MKNSGWISRAGIAVGIPVFVFGLTATPRTSTVAQGGPPPVGGPLQGLTQSDLNIFNQGRNEFLVDETPQTGLGPVFNGTACAQCHQAGAPGGASANLGVSVVTRIGGTVNGQYSDLTQFGGPLLQRRSLREIIPNYPVPGEVIPPQAQFVSRRITTPVFGAGLIEAIPAETILSRSGQNQGDGVMGVANMVTNPDTGAVEVGRFGWKSQVSTVHGFSGDAYRNEMGITNPSFPTENLPQGNPIPPGADQTADPEDEGTDVGLLTDFMRFLAPPAPLPATVNSARGKRIFGEAGCGTCHVPTMTTGLNSNPVFNNRNVDLYSDLLLHHMGPGLDDGVRQGQAAGDQWRTAPLWGLRFRNFYLHDGRATALDQAIKMHGGEAAFSVGQYLTLNRASQQNLIEFLSRL